MGLLTERERAVAVAEGLSNGEIAARLHLSMSSVRTHPSAAMTEPDMTNRTQLATLAHGVSRAARPGGG